MTIVWEANGSATSSVVRELAGSTDIRVVETLADVAAWVGYTPAERLVVIGADVPFIDVAAFAGYMHTIYPNVALVLVRHTDEADVTAEAMAAGIVEVVPAGSPEVLAAACRRATDSAVESDADQPAEPVEPASTTDGQHQVRTGALVVVFSAKGGSGKTVVSTNLAHTLAEQATVCLVDLDLEFGDVAICLQLAPSRNIADAVALDLTDDAALAALLTPHPTSGIDCVLAPINPGDAEQISAATVGQLLDRLRQRYDYVVVDTPSQFSEQVLEALDRATHHVIVTTPEIPALKNTRLTLDMLDLLGFHDAHRSLVVNCADRKIVPGVAEVESTLRTAVALELPATPAVPQSVNRGVPLLAGEPSHPFSFAVGEFAARTITGHPVPARRNRRRLHLRRRSA